jgi:hypothetical protein
MSITRKASDESGQMIILTAFCMIVIIAFLGFAIDVGHFRYVKRNLQSAADAAALAAALEVRICGGTANCPAMQAAAQNAMTENGLTGAAFLTNCSGSDGNGVTLMINNPTCDVSSDPNGGKLDYVEAIVSEKVPTYFAGILGITSETVAARAEAARIGGPCIVALGGPPGGPYTDGDNGTSPGISMIAGVLIHSRCPIWDESTSKNALECTLTVGVTAPQINVSGGVNGLLGLLPSLCGLWTTPSNLNVPALSPHDPLSYLQPPSNANNSCGSGGGGTWNGSSSPVNILLGGSYTFNPGVYCGGINIAVTLGANVTFNPGTYILRQTYTGLLGTPLLGSGGLNVTVTALSSIVGPGVTFYNEGGSTNITAASAADLSNFDLSAPTSGEYGGILFFQPSSNTSPDTFVVSAAQGSVFSGAIYAPDATVNYGVTALSSTYNPLVARDINFTVAALSEFGDDYSSLSSGTPMDGDDVMLVQ